MEGPMWGKERERKKRERETPGGILDHRAPKRQRENMRERDKQS